MHLLGLQRKSKTIASLTIGGRVE